MARSSARRNKAAQLRFAKLPAFSFIQAIVDVWEEARLNSEERLVSMFMCVAQGDACLIMMVRRHVHFHAYPGCGAGVG